MVTSGSVSYFPLFPKFLLFYQFVTVRLSVISFLFSLIPEMFHAAGQRLRVQANQPLHGQLRSRRPQGNLDPLK